MEELSYFAAWSHWLSGEIVTDSYLWGMKIFWWGRLGKIIGFLSALTVVAEIIGPGQLRDFGNSLHDRFSLQEFWNIVRKNFNQIPIVQYVLISFARRRNFESIQETDAPYRLLFNVITQYTSTLAGLMSIFLLYGIPVVIFVFLLRTANFCVAIWYSLLAFFIFAVFGTLIAAVVVSLPALILLLIDTLVIEPFAWILERKSLDKIIKLLSLLLLILGFHFDLLAS